MSEVGQDVIRRALDCALEAVAIADTDGRLTYVNGAFLALWRYQVPEQVLGRHASEFWRFPDDAAEVIRILGQAGHWEGILTGACADGTKLTVQVSAHQVRDRQGRPTAMMGSFRDLTALQEGEAALRREREFARRLIDATPAIVLVLAADGAIRSVNRYFERLTGWRSDEIQGRDWFTTFLPPGGRQRIGELFRTALAGTPTAGNVNAIVTRGGEERLIEWYDQVLRDDGGAVTALLVIGLDVTERQRTEQALRESEARLRAIVQSEPECIKLLDATGRVLDMNPAGLAMIEADSLDTVRGAEALQLVDPKYHGPFRDSLEETLAGRSTRLDFEIVGLRGGRRWLEQHAVPLYDGPVRGRVDRVLAVSRDITERKLAEQRLEEAQALAQVGHWELDPASGALRWSREIFRIFEIDPARFSASYEAFLDAVHPDDRQLVDRAYADSLAAHRPYRITHRLRMADGRIKWVEERCETHYDESGRALRSVGTVQDITRRIEAEQETERVRRLLQHVIDASPDWIFAKDLEHRFVLVNRSFARAMKLEPAQMIGRPDTDFWPRQLCEGDPAHGTSGFHDDDRRAFAGELTHNPEDRVTLADGPLHVFDTVKGPLRDESGRIVGVFSYSRDVTERRRVEQELARHREHLEELVAERSRQLVESERQLVAAQRIAGLGHWTVDLCSGELVWSDEIYRIFGRDPATYRPTRENFYACVHADDRELVRATETAADHAQRVSVDHRIVRPDGSVRWVHQEAQLERGESGQRRRLSGIVHDITERKQAEAEILRQSRRSELILNTARDGFFAADRQTRIRDANAAYCRMLGYTRDELLRLSIPDLEAGESLAEIAARMARVKVERQDRFDTRHRRKDGSAIDVEISGNLVEIGGEPMFFAFVRDITRRKQAEQELTAAHDEAQRASRAKSEFLSRMSHELRTPMNAILGFAQVLERDARLAVEQRGFVGEIRRAGDHLLQLINELLDLARIEAGKVAVEIEFIEVAAAVEQAIRIARPQEGAPAVEVVNRCPPAIAVLADATRLRQILVNLLSNAVKYNRPGGTVHVDCRVQADGRTRIFVADSGPGIAPERLALLFKPFERLGAEATGIEGTGIGLALSKSLAELMAGELGVESAPGCGSVFWLELPSAAADPPGAAAPAPDAAAAT